MEIKYKRNQKICKYIYIYIIKMERKYKKNHIWTIKYIFEIIKYIKS